MNKKLEEIRDLITLYDCGQVPLYRVFEDIREKLKDMADSQEYEVWEIVKRYPEELGFILQEQNYEMYLDTFNEEDRSNVPITEEEFNLVKTFFNRGNNNENSN